MKTLPRFKKVRIVDYSRYESGRSNNGGAYGFTTTYTPVGPDTYTSYYWTTAEFDFCQYCGGFSCHCYKEPEVISEAELIQQIEEANRNCSNEVYAEVDPMDDIEWGRKLRRRSEDSLRKANLETIIKIASILGVKFD